jgi:hypothetical protein
MGDHPRSAPAILTNSVSGILTNCGSGWFRAVYPLTLKSKFLNPRYQISRIHVTNEVMGVIAGIVISPHHRSLFVGVE